MSRKGKFTTIDAARRLLTSTESAIDNIIEEIKKPVDIDLTGSQRKAELQSIKQAVIDARELLQERQRLEQMIKDLEDSKSIDDQSDFSGGFAERFSK
jgi:hypothetical protein